MRTAAFVRGGGPQAEFRLGVKMGSNSHFGFLSPSHRLHAFYRWVLKADPEVLTPTTFRYIREFQVHAREPGLKEEGAKRAGRSKEYPSVKSCYCQYCQLFFAKELRLSCQ
jgi:hypothetical protein